MARDLNKAIEEIKARANIVDVISPLVSLKRTGSNYKGCCPFHNEKTPSFIVSENKQIFTCFGCHVSGDLFKFTEKYYNITFPEAVEKLASQYGVVIEEDRSENTRKKEGYYELNRQAARFFYDGMTKGANPGYSYMKKRKILPETIAKFGIGYADEEWSSLTEHLTSAGADPELMQEISLCSKGKNGKYYDYFRGRVIFPIINTRGKVIGFGGRILDNGEPKYLNSKESFIFFKKLNLFGLNLTKNEIQKQGYAIIVEGYMDVVGLYQGGIRNVAASLGTALTEDQAKLLKRFCNKVVLCYDSDQAGINAALRGIDVLRSAGLEIKVLNVDDGKDPDEYIKLHGADAFLELLSKKAVPDIEYKIGILQKKYDLSDTTSAIRFLNAAADVLRPLKPIEQDLYIKKIASDYNFSEGALRRSVAGKSSANSPKPRNEEAVNNTPGISPQQLLMEKTLFRLCFMHSYYYGKLKEYPEAFISPPARILDEAISSVYSDGKDLLVSDFRDSLDEDTYAYLEDIMNNILIGEDDRSAFDDCVSKMDSARRKQRIHQIKDILQLSEEDGAQTGENVKDLLKELIDLQSKEKK